MFNFNSLFKILYVKIIITEIIKIIMLKKPKNENFSKFDKFSLKIKGNKIIKIIIIKILSL